MLSIGAVDIGDSLQRGLDELVAFLPRLVGFLIILLIGWLIARAVKVLIVKALQGVGIDRALSSGSAGPYVARAMPDARPSELIGTIAFWFLFLGAIAIAVSQLGISALDNFVALIAAYLPNIVVAILIFVLAGAIAAAVSGLISRTLADTTTGKIAAAAAPVLIMGIATFMILDQLDIAPAIVEITYIALLGSVALGMALAFGLGGREVAGRMLSDAYDKGQEQRGQVRRDMEVGKERGKQDAQRAKDEAQARTGNGQTETRPVTTGTGTGTGTDGGTPDGPTGSRRIR